jgi:hypothetical protein
MISGRQAMIGIMSEWLIKKDSRGAPKRMEWFLAGNSWFFHKAVQARKSAAMLKNKQERIMYFKFLFMTIV